MALTEVEQQAALEAADQRITTVQQQQVKAADRATRTYAVEKAIQAAASLNCHGDDLVKLARDLHAFITESEA
ncbi:MAG TPA: hypothetical protein VFB45_15480 [Pseudolabrys sp.]|nr:hypothetical protein [Pseudolabrys sp.]